jgi:hypothetical protein
MTISDQRLSQHNAKNAFGFAPVLSTQDFTQRGPLEIVLTCNKLGTTVKALIESCAGGRGSR